MSAVTSEGTHLDFQEFCNGSGRLSVSTFYGGLLTALPVDYRHSWDMQVAGHRRLLDQLLTRIRFYSPSCAPWTVATGFYLPEQGTPSVSLKALFWNGLPSAALKLTQPMALWRWLRILKAAVSVTSLLYPASIGRRRFQVCTRSKRNPTH